MDFRTQTKRVLGYGHTCNSNSSSSSGHMKSFTYMVKISQLVPLSTYSDGFSQDFDNRILRQGHTWEPNYIGCNYQSHCVVVTYLMQHIILSSLCLLILCCLCHQKQASTKMDQKQTSAGMDQQKQASAEKVKKDKSR